MAHSRRRYHVQGTHLRRTRLWRLSFNACGVANGWLTGCLCWCHSFDQFAHWRADTTLMTNTCNWWNAPWLGHRWFLMSRGPLSGPSIHSSIWKPKRKMLVLRFLFVFSSLTLAPSLSIGLSNVKREKRMKNLFGKSRHGRPSALVHAQREKYANLF